MRPALLLACAAATTSCIFESRSVESFVRQLKGYDLSKLSLVAQETFAKALDARLCPCRHRHSVSLCVLRDQPRCEESHRIARYALRRVKAGDGLSRLILMLDRIFPPGEEPQVIPLGTAPIRGPANAPVTLVVFADFECPTCRKVLPAVDRMWKAFPGKIRLAFKHLPLPIHRFATIAARAAIAAQHQGKFWEMHDLLFENQTALSREAILGLARRLKLDLPRFEKDLDDPRTLAAVKADVELARRLGVRATPTFFIDGRRLYGEHTFENLRDHVEVAVERADDQRRASR